MNPSATYKTKTLLKVLKALNHFSDTAPLSGTVVLKDGEFSVYSTIQCTISNTLDEFQISNTGVQTATNLKQLIRAVEAGKKAEYTTITDNPANTLTLDTTIKSNQPTVALEGFESTFKTDTHLDDNDLLDDTAYARISYRELMSLTTFSLKYDDRLHGFSNILYSVYVEKGANRLVVCDGTRAHTASGVGVVEVDSVKDFEGIVINVEALRKLAKAVKALGIKPTVVKVLAHGTRKEVTLRIEGAFNRGYAIEVTHKMEGSPYPRYEGLFTPNPTYRAEFGIDAMLETLTELKPFVNPRKPIVKLAFQPTAKSITPSAESEGEVTTGRAVPTTHFNNPQWDALPHLHLNITYFTEALKMYRALGYRELQLATNGRLEPCLLHPVYETIDPDRTPPNAHRHMIATVDVKESE